MRHNEARDHLVVEAGIAGIRGVRGTGNHNRRVAPQAARQLVADELKHARAALAPDEQHGSRDPPELRAGHRREILLTIGEQLVSQLEGVYAPYPEPTTCAGAMSSVSSIAAKSSACSLGE